MPDRHASILGVWLSPFAQSSDLEDLPSQCYAHTPFGPLENLYPWFPPPPQQFSKLWRVLQPQMSPITVHGTGRIYSLLWGCGSQGGLSSVSKHVFLSILRSSFKDILLPWLVFYSLWSLRKALAFLSVTNSPDPCHSSTSDPSQLSRDTLLRGMSERTSLSSDL